MAHLAHCRYLKMDEEKKKKGIERKTCRDKYSVQLTGFRFGEFLGLIGGHHIHAFLKSICKQIKSQYKNRGCHLKVNGLNHQLDTPH